MLSPIAVVLQELRHVVIDPSAPSAADAIGTPALLLVPAAIVVIALVLGIWVFAREAPRIAEEL